MDLKTLWRLLKKTGEEWYNDDPFQVGAALAYCAVFSVTPLCVIAIFLASLILGEKAAKGEITTEIGHLVDPTVADAVQSIVQNARNSSSGILATLIGIVILFFGATGVFAQLQSSLNRIWKVRAKSCQGVWCVVRSRFLSFAVVLAIGFLLLTSVVITTALSALSRIISPDSVPGGLVAWRIVNAIISLGLFTLLFALIYKVLPDVRIDWGDVWIGAALTAILFDVGKYLIGLYLVQASVTSAYGAAGSLVVILMWVYYAAQIFLFGAEFTRVHAQEHGKPLVPTENARALSSTRHFEGIEING